MLSPFKSRHVRVSVSEIIGLYCAANAVAAFCAYLLTLTLSAALASPKMSYTTPRRGEMLYQFGRFGMAGNVRAGTNRPAPAVCAATPAFRWSNRIPALRGILWRVQTS